MARSRAAATSRWSGWISSTSIPIRSHTNAMASRYSVPNSTASGPARRSRRSGSEPMPITVKTKSGSGIVEASSSSVTSIRRTSAQTPVSPRTSRSST
ncbi:MAG: hypothetical protein ACLQB1_30195 [Streptosporangiaceae bacterium]